MYFPWLTQQGKKGPIDQSSNTDLFSDYIRQYNRLITCSDFCIGLWRNLTWVLSIPAKTPETNMFRRGSNMAHAVGGKYSTKELASQILILLFRAFTSLPLTLIHFTRSTRSSARIFSGETLCLFDLIRTTCKGNQSRQGHHYEGTKTNMSQ